MIIILSNNHSSRCFGSIEELMQMYEKNPVGFSGFKQLVAIYSNYEFVYKVENLYNCVNHLTMVLPDLKAHYIQESQMEVF